MNTFGLMSILSAISDVAKKLEDGSYENIGTGYAFLAPILRLVDNFMIPLMIVVLAAGTIYAVILGVNMARADSSETRDAAKKRLINCIVGFAIIVVLLAIIYALAANIESVLGLATTETVQ